MKTMTCKQLGGPCDLPLRGETADEVIHAQDAHLKEVVAGGDDAHRDALEDMKGRWKRPDLRNEVVPERQARVRCASRGVIGRDRRA